MSQMLEQKIDQAASFILDSDALMIGAGAGLSAAAGFNFSNKDQFARDYPGMFQYGFSCKLDMMANFSVPEELLWGYYLQHVKETRFSDGTHAVYQDLQAISGIQNNYFVLTTNADGLFERNHFDPGRIFTPQGDYRLVQCLKPCTQQTWPVEPLIDHFLPLVDKTTQKLPAGNCPKCPNCGGPMFLNVRGGDWFVEEPWVDSSIRFNQWLSENKNLKLVVLDIGSGFNTPVWVRWPSEKLVRGNPRAHLIRINLDHPDVPQDIKGHSLSFSEPADQIIARIRKALNR